jgi:hypothetical protein
MDRGLRRIGEGSFLAEGAKLSWISFVGAIPGIETAKRAKQKRLGTVKPADSSKSEVNRMGIGFVRHGCSERIAISYHYPADRDPNRAVPLWGLGEIQN